MYGFECQKKITKGACQDKGCLFPVPCSALRPNHSQYLDLLKRLGGLAGIKKYLSLRNPIRSDPERQTARDGISGKLVKDHVSGQLKSHRNIVSHMFLTTWANRPWMT